MGEMPSFNPIETPEKIAGHSIEQPNPPVEQATAIEAREIGKYRPEFSLDGWAYDQLSLDRLTTKLEEKNPGIRARLEQSLIDGGGKAYGLVICELIANQYQAEGHTVSVPKWESIPNYTEQRERIEEEFSTRQYRNEAGQLHSKVILRSSAPDEDWLAAESGVLRSFTDHERIKLATPLPEVPFILQELASGYGAVIDVGHSELRGEVVVHFAVGNGRGKDNRDFSSAVSDPEASVALFNERGDSIVPSRSYRGAFKPFFENETLPHNNLLPDITTKLRNLGIDFGVQLEAVIDGQNPNIVHIIQIRPTPEKMRRIVVQNSETSPETLDTAGEVLAETAVTSGVFNLTAQPTFNLEGQISNLSNDGRPLAQLVRTLHDLEQFALRAQKKGIPYAQQERLDELRAYFQAQEKVVPEELRIGFFNTMGSGSDPSNRISLDTAHDIYAGAYQGGYRGLITPGQITPATKHEYLLDQNPAMTKYIAEHCGMISIPKEQIAAIQEIYANSPGAKLRIASDGLIGQVILYRGEDAR